MINKHINPRLKLGYHISLRFDISQNTKEELLLRSIADFLGCGVYYPDPKRQDAKLKVTKFTEISEKIVPFFDQYKIIGIKFLDYADFVKVVQIMKVKGHTTSEGLNQILEIKQGMNRGRLE